MQHALPKLPYNRDALEPHISATTLDYHHGKHHAAYVNKLNELVQNSELKDATLEEVVQNANGTLFNQAAQVWNHSFYWNSMTPERTAPSQSLEALLVSGWGSLDAFKKAFKDAAVAHFGSGWVWLVQQAQAGKLSIVSTHDAGCPIANGDKPLLACDVWEHAYYLDYQNARPNYVDHWWNVANWDFANRNYDR